MSFGTPLVLIALVAIPVLGVWYAYEQRRRDRAAEAFVSAPLRASVTPHTPGRRRHVPMAIIGAALIVLIFAAAKPTRSVAVPVDDGAVMLANDVTASMASTDVAPSREVAGRNAAALFLSKLPSSVRAGLMEFDVNATVLQSPTTDHALTRDALSHLHPPHGHTAIGVAIQAATRLLSALKAQNGKRVPGAIVLLSDGGSDIGIDPLVTARQAKAAHIPVYTVAIGTSHGTIPVKHGRRNQVVPVPVETAQLGQIAAQSGGKAFTAGDPKQLQSIYSHLAAQIGHKHVKHQMTASFAGAGLLLLLAGAALSLVWFARLI